MTIFFLMRFLTVIVIFLPPALKISYMKIMSLQDVKVLNAQKDLGHLLLIIGN